MMLNHYKTTQAKKSIILLCLYILSREHPGSIHIDFSLCQYYNNIIISCVRETCISQGWGHVVRKVIRQFSHFISHRISLHKPICSSHSSCVVISHLPKCHYLPDSSYLIPLE